MAVTPVKLVGVGKIFDATNNVCLSNQAEFSYVHTVEELAVPAGDDFGEEHIPTKQTHGGRLACRDYNGSLLAALIGGSTAAGSTKFVSKEAQTVPATPFGVALDNAANLYTPAGCTYAPIEVVDSDGVTYEQVAGGSEAEGKFSESAGTLTFDAADEGKVLSITYWWTDSVNGVTVSPSVTSIVGGKTYIFSGYGYCTRQSTQKGWMTVVVKHLQRTGDVTVGAGVGDAGTISFDYRAKVSVTTDLQISFEQD